MRSRPSSPTGPKPGPAGTLRERILKLMREPRYQPLEKVELSKKLGLPSDQRSALRVLLRSMEQEGAIARIRKDRYVLPQEANLCTGILRVSRGGNARLDCGTEPHIFVPAEKTSVAMNGDRVVARLIFDARQRGPRQGQPAAEVIRILERANNTIVGTLQSSKRFFFVVPDDSRIVHHIYVLPERDTAVEKPNVGDKVVVRLEEWISPAANPEGRIIEVLGTLGRPRGGHAFDYPAQ